MKRAIETLVNAGQYLVTSRDISLEGLTATEAARNSNPDIKALALLAVKLACVVGETGDGWIQDVEANL